MMVPRTKKIEKLKDGDIATVEEKNLIIPLLEKELSMIDIHNLKGVQFSLTYANKHDLSLYTLVRKELKKYKFRMSKSERKTLSLIKKKLIREYYKVGHVFKVPNTDYINNEEFVSILRNTLMYQKIIQECYNQNLTLHEAGDFTIDGDYIYSFTIK